MVWRLEAVHANCVACNKHSTGRPDSVRSVAQIDDGGARNVQGQLGRHGARATEAAKILHMFFRYHDCVVFQVFYNYFDTGS